MEADSVFTDVVSALQHLKHVYCNVIISCKQFFSLCLINNFIVSYKQLFHSVGPYLRTPHHFWLSVMVDRCAVMV